MKFMNPDTYKKMTLLEDIYTSLRLNDITFSKTESIKIVGGRGILEKLVASGKIRTKKIPCLKFRRWECMAEDVLRYANYKKRNGIDN